MPFKLIEFTPIGAQASGGPVNVLSDADNINKGDAPQVFAYKTPDTLAVVKKAGYFDELKGVLKPEDWIYVTTSFGGTEQYALLMVQNDALTKFQRGALTAVKVAGGTGYAVGDLVSVTYTNGTINEATILRVTGESAGVVDTLEVAEPGVFAVDPTALTGLATVAQTGGGNNALTATITIGDVVGSSAQIVVHKQDINAV